MTIVFNFIEMLFVFIVYNVILNMNLKKRILFYILLAVGMAVANSVFIYYIGINKVFSILVVTVIASWVLSKKFNIDNIETLTHMIISTITISIIEITVAFPLGIIVRNIEISYITLIVILLFAMTVWTIIINKFLNKFKEIRCVLKNCKFNIAIFNFCAFFLSLLTLGDILQMSIKALMQISTICITIIVVNFYYLIRRNRHKDFNKKVEIDNNINPLIEDLLKDMKAKEHEYNNHLTVMYSMIQVCSLEELRNRTKCYLGEIEEKNQYLAEVAYIKNTIVQAIMYNKLKEADKDDITLNHEIESNLENIKLDNSELTVILSNLINNAIEASRKQLNKEIDVYIGDLGEKHIIKVSNWIDDEKIINIKNFFKLGFSTKDSKRGYGLHNIKLIVDKYKGKVDVEVKENRILFIVEV